MRPADRSAPGTFDGRVRIAGMSSGQRRQGSEESGTRTALLDATAQIMLEEGYAAVSSRRVAAQAGIKPALVHYYFRSMDDLFLAVFRRGAEANLARQQAALREPRHLWALWEIDIDPRGTALLTEFMALANHRKAIRAEIAAYAERFRETERAALAAALEARGGAPAEIDPLVATLFMTGISRILVMERALGITMGHQETLELVNLWLEALDPAEEH
ncbi:regulatory protein, tetR family [Parafrankia irregularis]|uniref:Regulatory protein, tetR family n=2 Tax=Frankiaceae TaxID=74712 RepID=A0A0S4QTV8_9ACTN|nr:regulatory protein, tetR family [Parafrankia irregularis]